MPPSARLADVRGFFNKLMPTPDLVMEAFTLGDAVDVPVYDCAYVVLLAAPAHDW